MKQMVVSSLLICAAAPMLIAQNSSVNNSRSNIKNNIAFSQGPGGKLVCTNAQGRPCTGADLQQFNNQLKDNHPSITYSTTKSNIKAITVAKDGSIECVTLDASPCRAEVVKELNSIALGMKPNSPSQGSPASPVTTSNPGK